jgi:hypothetical protein
MSLSIRSLDLIRISHSYHFYLTMQELIFLILKRFDSLHRQSSNPMKLMIYFYLIDNLFYTIPFDLFNKSTLLNIVTLYSKFFIN